MDPSLPPTPTRNPLPQPLLPRLAHAYARLAPHLLHHPDELRARLARLSGPNYTRIPRALCLVVRAADSRISEYHHRILTHHIDHVLPHTPNIHTRRTRHLRPPPTPPASLDPDDHHSSLHPSPRTPHPVLQPRHHPHSLILDAPALRRLCPPILCPEDGMDWQLFADLVGRQDGSLRYAMASPDFIIHFRTSRLPHRNRGRPVPYLYPRATPHYLDPSASNLTTPAHPLIVELSEHLLRSLPPDFEQEVTRTPHTRLHKPSRQPLFRGWKFICPACRKTARALYLPLPPPPFPPTASLRQQLYAVLSPADRDRLQSPAPPPTLACRPCHRVRYYSPNHKLAWNHLLLHLTSGLLFGHDLPPPPGY